MKEIKLREHNGTSQGLESLDSYFLRSSLALSRSLLGQFLSNHQFNPSCSAALVPKAMTLHFKCPTLTGSVSEHLLSISGTKVKLAWVVVWSLTYQQRLGRWWEGCPGVFRLPLLGCEWRRSFFTGRKCVMVNITDISSTKPNRDTTGLLTLFMLMLRPFFKWYPTRGIYFMFPQIIPHLKYISSSLLHILFSNYVKPQ